MPLPSVSNFSPSAFTLSCTMLDCGTDGISGGANGSTRFITPIRGRVRSVCVGHELANAAATGFRVDSAGGTIGDAETLAGNRIPAGALAGSGVNIIGFNQGATPLAAGEMFRVRSDGGNALAPRAGVTVQIEPVEPAPFPGLLFAITDYFLDGTVAQVLRYPSLPQGFEVLKLWVGLSGAVAAQAQTIALLRNNTDAIGAGVSMAAGGADLTVFSSTDYHLSANRFIRPSDFLAVTCTGGANFTTQVPFTILCRRL